MLTSKLINIKNMDKTPTQKSENFASITLQTIIFILIFVSFYNSMF